MRPRIDRTTIMSLDFSHWMRDDAHAHSRRRLCRDRRAGVQRAFAVVRRPLVRWAFASHRSIRPGAVALVADVVMVSVAAAVALVATQSIAP
jgi:hypothetical protein